MYISFILSLALEKGSDSPSASSVTYDPSTSVGLISTLLTTDALKAKNRSVIATSTSKNIEELTGIKAHILRYWEETIPVFTPQKDTGGRRVYSQREVELVLRLKYLINEKKNIGR